MDSYRVEKQATLAVLLADANAEIEPVPTDAGGARPDPDQDRVRRMITEEIPERVATDPVFHNAQRNSDRNPARLEHDRALGRVIIGLMNDNAMLFKQYSDNKEFKRWLADSVFKATYLAAA